MVSNMFKCLPLSKGNRLNVFNALIANEICISFIQKDRLQEIFFYIMSLLLKLFQFMNEVIQRINSCWQIESVDLICNLYNKMQYSQRQLNLLCIGQRQAGRSSFLQHYTASSLSEEHYKIFAKHLPPSTVIFLHEIQQKEGMQVYLKYPYDGLLFFVNEVSYHNTYYVLMQHIVSFSQYSGINAYKIPILAVMLAKQKQGQYGCIPHTQKQKFVNQISNVLTPSQIIFMEAGTHIQNLLNSFYKAILHNQSLGIRQTLYTQWFLRGLLNFVPIDQLQLNIKRLMQEFKKRFLLSFKQLNIFSLKKES